MGSDASAPGRRDWPISLLGGRQEEKEEATAAGWPRLLTLCLLLLGCLGPGASAEDAQVKAEVRTLPLHPAFAPLAWTGVLGGLRGRRWPRPQAEAWSWRAPTRALRGGQCWEIKGGPDPLQAVPQKLARLGHLLANPGRPAFLSKLAPPFLQSSTIQLWHEWPYTHPPTHPPPALSSSPFLPPSRARVFLESPSGRAGTSIASGEGAALGGAEWVSLRVMLVWVAGTSLLSLQARMGVSGKWGANPLGNRQLRFFGDFLGLLRGSERALFFPTSICP